MSREYPTPVRFELVVPDVRQFCNSNGLNYGAINFAFIAFPAVAVRITVKPFAILWYCIYRQCMRFFSNVFWGREEIIIWQTNLERKICKRNLKRLNFNPSFLSGNNSSAKRTKLLYDYLSSRRFFLQLFRLP